MSSPHRNTCSLGAPEPGSRPRRHAGLVYWIPTHATLLTRLGTSVRLSDLAPVTFEELILEGGWLRLLHAKGNKAYSRYGNLRLGVTLQPNGLKQMLRRLAKAIGIPKVHADRFRRTFATRAIEQDARELDVLNLVGHASPDMVRRNVSIYNSEQAGCRRGAFSSAERLPAGA